MSYNSHKWWWSNVTVVLGQPSWHTVFPGIEADGDSKLMTIMKRTMGRHVILAAALCILLLGCSSVAVACPTCAEGVANDPHHENLVRGYFWSIIFMMSMPFLIFTGLCGYFYYEIRRARARQAAGGEYAVPTVSAPSA